MSINKPAVKPILLGKKVILKPDKRPTVGSDSLVTSGALADALYTKIIIDSEGNINSTSDIVIGKLGEDTAFYIIDPDFVGIKYKKVESPELGKLYYDKFTKTYYTFQGNILEDNVGIVGYKFKPLVLPSIVKVTWQELKDLRDNSKLIPGLKYRITDYQCTTTQENTRSAGHQFDIVLLALSENKLAEEGWAMMHDNIYDVTFGGGVTKKCWLYEEPDAVNLVDYNTHNGGSFALEDIIINEVDKTVDATDFDYDECMTESDLTYNYFQNSNLSAWKVWYCLDNDKSRFAWADDSVDEDVPAKIITQGGRNFTFSAGGFFIRSEQYDEVISNKGVRESYYAWIKDDNNSIIVYTTSNPPLVNSYLYVKNRSGEFEQASGNKVNEYTPAHKGTGLPNGRGVIYRLIDEWNNDIPYDFKNILIYNETYSQYCYAIIDNTENNFDVDPTLDGTKVKAIHILCDNNDELKPIAKGGFGNNPLVNIIFLNNSILADEYSNCVVSNGVPI